MKATAAQRRAASTLLDAVQDPVDFAHRVLGHDTWWTQRAILNAIGQPHARVAVKACHGSSKTFTASEATLWFLARYRDGKVVTTAPVFKQVKTLLWGEIHTALRGSRLAYPEPNRTDLYIDSENFGIGISTRDATSFQGYHGSHVLLIIDEAPGVRPEIFEAVAGIEAGGDVRILMLGNPTIRGGPYFEAFHASRASWSTFSISAFNTPNVRPLMPEGLDVRGLDRQRDGELLDALRALPDEAVERPGPFPQLVGARWILARAAEWGVDSPAWDSRVMGRFPRQAEDALVNVDDLEAHRHEPPPVPADDEEPEPLEVGVDPAGPGENETAVTVRRGDHVLGLHTTMDADPRGWTARLLRTMYGGPRVISVVKVDCIGEGRLVQRHLEDLGYNVVPVNVGIPPVGASKADRARAKDEYVNLRAQLYWAVRQRAADGELRGLDDDTAISQLGAIRWSTDPRGRIRIESKDDMKRRGMPSPDRADSVMLAFADVRRRMRPRVKVHAG